MSRAQEIEALGRTLDAPTWKFWVTEHKRVAASIALMEIGAEAIPRLIACLAGPGGSFASTALVDIGRSCVPACLRAFASPSPTRGYAMLVVLDILGDDAVDPLVSQLGGAGAATAVVGLKRVGPSAVPALIAALRDPNADVRMTAAVALKSMGRWAADAIPALEAALDDSESIVRDAARGALDEVRG